MNTFTMSRWFPRICIGLFVIGVGLLLLNLYGLTRSLEKPALASDENTAFIADKTLDYPTFLRKYPKHQGEQTDEYVQRIMLLVNQTMAHYWHTESARLDYHGQVPIWENYWLALLGRIFPERYSFYEFFEWRYALERGIGLCSQHSLAVSGILNEQGIPARVVQLNGHVVAEAQIRPDVWWIIDADYGINMPFDVEFAAAHPDRVLEHYRNIRDLCRPSFERCAYPEGIVSVYVTKDDNKRAPIGKAAYSPAGYWLERLAYLGKWLFPVFLVVVSLAGFVWKRRSVGAAD